MLGTEQIDAGLDGSYVSTPDSEVPQVAKELGGLVVALGQLRGHEVIDRGPRLRLSSHQFVEPASTSLSGLPLSLCPLPLCPLRVQGGPFALPYTCVGEEIPRRPGRSCARPRRARARCPNLRNELGAEVWITSFDESNQERRSVRLRERRYPPLDVSRTIAGA